MVGDLIFVGFNSRVVALRRDTGAVAWTWKSPAGRGYVTLLLDGDRLVVSVVGYTYCLDPRTGQQLWFNELEGMGTGVVSLASARGGSAGMVPQAAQEIAARQDSARSDSSP